MPAHPPLTGARLAAVLHALDAGTSLLEACSAADCSPTAARNRLRKLGFVIPPQGRPGPHIVTREEVLAELAKLSKSIEEPPPSEPTAVAPPVSAPPPAAVPSEFPIGPALRKAIADATMTSAGRMKLADRLRGVTGLKLSFCQSAVNKLSSGTIASLPAESAANLCTALGVAPESMFADWPARVPA